MMIYDKIVESPYEPMSTNVLWLRPTDMGFSFYRYKNGKWEALKLMNDQGTSNPDDDEPYVPGGEVGPDTVGSAEIIDGSVRTQDLSKEVTDKLDDVYVQNNETLYINGTKPE